MESIVKHSVEESNITIEPNNLHVWEKVPAELTIAFTSAESENSYAEYQMEIHCNQDCTLVLPSSIKNGSAIPNILNNGEVYLISVLNDIAIYKNYKEVE